MRNLHRNTQAVTFRALVGETERMTPSGQPTGVKDPVYGPAQTAFLCVSPSRGAVENEMFGQLEGYDRAMTTADPNCPIDETCVLWIDGAPPMGPYNYVVVLSAPWKNSKAYAIRKVTVRG